MDDFSPFLSRQQTFPRHPLSPSLSLSPRKEEREGWSNFGAAVSRPFRVVRAQITIQSSLSRKRTVAKILSPIILRNNYRLTARVISRERNKVGRGLKGTFPPSLFTSSITLSRCSLPYGNDCNTGRDPRAR